MINGNTYTIDLDLVHFIGHDPGFEGKHYIAITLIAHVFYL